MLVVSGVRQAAPMTGKASPRDALGFAGKRNNFDYGCTVRRAKCFVERLDKHKKYFDGRR